MSGIAQPLLAPRENEQDYHNDSDDGTIDEGEELLEEIVDGVVDQFVREFELRLASLGPLRLPLRLSLSASKLDTRIPETEEQYRAYVWDFVDKNLSLFYPPGDPSVEELIKRAAERAKDITDEYQLSRGITPSLVKMALYDFVILCETLRDLNRTHVVWLKHMREKILDAVVRAYPDLDRDQIKLYVHYQPTYYHFHIHVVNVMLEAGTTQATGKAFGLENLISQLETMDGGAEAGMADVSLTYFVGESHELWANVFAPLKQGETPSISEN